MRYSTFAGVALVAVAGATPAMAQAGPSAYDPPIAGRTPAANAAGSHLELLQGYGKNGEVTFTWYYVMPPDFSRYHGS
jgi:hypothetical protein